MPLAAFWITAGCRATRCLVASPAAGCHLASSGQAPATAASLTDELTGIGTLALAIITMATLIATIVMSRHGDRQSRERERLAEASAVQVVGGATTVVVNHGRYAINDVTARLRLSDRRLVEFTKLARILSVQGISSDLNARQALQFERTLRPEILTPWDVGLRFDADPEQSNSGIADAYPIVRWQDQWGKYWEHRLGHVRPIGKDDAWAPDTD